MNKKSEIRKSYVILPPCLSGFQIHLDFHQISYPSSSYYASFDPKIRRLFHFLFLVYIKERIFCFLSQVMINMKTNLIKSQVWSPIKELSFPPQIYIWTNLIKILMHYCIFEKAFFCPSKCLKRNLTRCGEGEFDFFE